jgi:hypothetical protein
MVERARSDRIAILRDQAQAHLQRQQARTSTLQPPSGLCPTMVGALPSRDALR